MHTRSSTGVALPIILVVFLLLVVFNSTDKERYECPKTSTVAELVGVESVKRVDDQPVGADDVTSDCLYLHVASGSMIRAYAQEIRGGADDQWETMVSNVEDGYDDVGMDARNAVGDSFTQADDGQSLEGVNLTPFGLKDGRPNAAYFTARRAGNNVLCHVSLTRPVVDQTLTEPSRDSVQHIADEFC